MDSKRFTNYVSYTMTLYPAFCIHIFHLYIVAVAIFIVHTHSQDDEKDRDLYVKVFADKDFQGDATFTKSGVENYCSCFSLCRGQLKSSCIGFTFNERQRVCKGYNESVVGLTEIIRNGTVGYGKCSALVRQFCQYTHMFKHLSL